MPQVLPVISPASISNQIQQLSNGSTTGVIVNPATDSSGNPSKIGFFGASPVVQPPAPPAKVTDGLINGYAPTLSPSAVAANTTAEQTFTVTGLAAGSVVIVNKPTAQAGLGIVGARVSAANTVGITFSNDTASSITPTASEVYQVVEITGGDPLLFTSVLTPTAVAAGVTSEQTFTVNTGNVQIGTAVAVNKPTAQAGLGVAGARVSAANQISISFINNTASSITPTAAETYSFADVTSVVANSNFVTYNVNVGTLSATGAATTAEQIVAVSGILATDFIVGVSKPTAQAGLGIAGQRVSSAGNIGITFVNPTASSITPTASEIYSVLVFRAAPVAPAVPYTQTLAPAAVSANTTAEQTFTVTGLVAGSAVLVNKPSAQGGLAVVNARVSAANTLALTYQNNTAAAITPATEAYVIVNFPQTEGGAETSQTVSPMSASFAYMVNALTGLGLIL